MKKNLLLYVLAVLLLPVPAVANIMWDWSFSTEVGTFETNGALVGGLAPAANYTFDTSTFAVTASQIAGLVGATYTATMPTQGFQWNGTQPTQFWRNSGALTNGSNFTTILGGTTYGHGFYVSGSPKALLTSIVGGQTVINTQGSLSVAPVPEPATICLLGLGGLLLRRRKRA